VDDDGEGDEGGPAESIDGGEGEDGADKKFVIDFEDE
jgi:hypothetical protein